MVDALLCPGWAQSCEITWEGEQPDQLDSGAVGAAPEEEEKGAPSASVAPRRYEMFLRAG